MSRQALLITDAQGARRVADLLMPHQIEIRLAAEDDAEMIYDWRTAPSVLGVSRNSKLFTFEEHCAWLRQTLLSPDRLLLVGAHKGKDIGVVRFDINNASAEVSIFLSPGTTGAGLGRALLTAAEARLNLSRPDIRRVDAWVNEDNPASLNMFKHLGYSPRISRLEKEIA
jgi:RimJ/RimL family protein N-acetyltransferase